MLRELFAILFAAAFALAFSQVPVFVQEYEQRLGGASSELLVLARQYQTNAMREGMTLEGYLSRHLENADATVRATGQTMSDTLARLRVLRADAEALEEASAWKKPFVLATRWDARLFAETWEKFAPTLTLDIHWGIAGLAAGFLLNHALVLLATVGGRPRRRIG